MGNCSCDPIRAGFPGWRHDLIAAAFVQRGELIEVLTKFVDNQVVPIYAVMLPERHRLPKIKACVAFWAEWLPQFSAAPKVN